MATHYAISELLIVVAGISTIRQFIAGRQTYAALATLLFTIAAGWGVVRFSFGLIEPMAETHKVLGTLGGLIGLISLTHELIRRHIQPRLVSAHFTIALILIIVSIFNPMVRVAFFLVWSIGLILAASKYGHLSSPLKNALCAGLMLANVVFFRQNPFLDPALAWHIFHVLTALWLFLLPRFIYTPARYS